MYIEYIEFKLYHAYNNNEKHVFVKVLFEMQSCLNYPFDVEKLI